MVAVLLAHGFHEPSRGFLESVARIKAGWGWVFSGAVSILAGAVLPECLRWLVIQRGKWTRANLGELAFAAPFWCGMGIMVDFFYRWQVVWFGDEPVISVVVSQVVVDQFVYNPLFAAPVTVWLYAWKNQGYRWRRDFLTPGFYRDRVVPALFATWGVWIPVVTVLYLLPETVQIPLFALALSLWVIIFSWMAREPS